MITKAVELQEINQVNVLTDRVKRLKEEYLAEKDIHACPERGLLVTESWKETEGEPIVLRRAKALRKILEGIPIVIREGELIVGSQTKYIRGYYPYYEWMPSRIIQEFQKDDHDAMSEEEKRSLLEDAKYWEGKSVVSQIKDAYRQLWGSKMDDYDEAVMWTPILNSPPTGCHMNHPRVLNESLNSFITEAKRRIDKLTTFTSPSEVKKLYFWQAVIIACEAVINYAKRHAELAKKLALEERDEARKRELRKIAEICEWVPENPARDFYEALQSFWFTHLCVNHERATRSEPVGRFDQYMYPFYEKDIREGRLTGQEAAELLGCLWVKFAAMESFRHKEDREISSATHLQNLTIGGVTEDGDDATNEFSFLVLEVARQTKLHQPHISLRYHDGISEEFLVKAVETNRDVRAGIPAFFNDKAEVLHLCELGVPLNEARNWAPIGCVEGYPWPSSAAHRQCFFDLPKCLELALNNGTDPRTGKQIGPATGDPRGFATFNEFYDAVKQQVSATVETIARATNVARIIRGELFAIPFNSALVNGCMETGVDALQGGMRWSIFVSGLVPIGHVNVANSLAAIKKVIYEDKAMTMDELLEALASNFEGKEGIHKTLLAAPKYGNDDDYADWFMKDIFTWTEGMVKQQTNCWGQPYVLSRQGLTVHLRYGKRVGALPDGRKAWQVLADGSLSPMRGTDTKGPTAVFNSASKVDAMGSESTLLNLKFNPRTVQTREGIRKFLSLIKTYFDRYGYHVQFNIVEKETLLDAKKHPEKYRDLLVRVAGFSAHFVELAPEVQDEIIARTEQEF